MARKPKNESLFTTSKGLGSPPKPPKKYTGKVIKKAENYYMDNDMVFKIPFFVKMMEQFKSQGASDAEAFSSTIASDAWQSYSFLGDDG